MPCRHRKAPAPCAAGPLRSLFLGVVLVLLPPAGSYLLFKIPLAIALCRKVPSQLLRPQRSHPLRGEHPQEPLHFSLVGSF